MSSPVINSKLPNVGTTIFTVMSGLANEHKAINLGQGFPDYQMNEELMNKVSEVMQKGWNQYVPMQGYMPLRESIAEKIEYLYQTKIDPGTQITITPGGTYAIYTALTTILQPGDEVIIFEPGYDSYIPNVEINGAIPVLIDLKFPEYKIDWDEVRKKVSPKTKAIMLNSSGSYFICAKYDRISDEADRDFAIRITKEFGVATIPVSVFYKAGTDNKVIRFCFSKKKETLEAAIERLVKI